MGSFFPQYKFLGVCWAMNVIPKHTTTKDIHMQHLLDMERLQWMCLRIAFTNDACAATTFIMVNTFGGVATNVLMATGLLVG